jgi:hypothetical protein
VKLIDVSGILGRFASADQGAAVPFFFILDVSDREIIPRKNILILYMYIIVADESRCRGWLSKFHTYMSK